MAVTARFYISSVTRRASRAMSGYASPAPVGDVVLHPATQHPDNKAWASATPSGKFEMSVRGDALPWFEENLGRDIHITMELAPHEVEETA